jgi:hypothetical protein
MFGRECLEVAAWSSSLGQGSAPAKVPTLLEQRIHELGVAFSKKSNRVFVVVRAAGSGSIVVLGMVQRGLVKSEDGSVYKGDGQHGRCRLRKSAAGENGMLGFHGWRTKIGRPVPVGIDVQPAANTRQEASQGRLIQYIDAEHMSRERVLREGVDGRLFSPAQFHGGSVILL